VHNLISSFSSISLFSFFHCSTAYM